MSGTAQANEAPGPTGAAPRRYAVIGTGLMGTAVARHLAAQKLGVLAWNRTHARAEPLRGSGVRVHRDLDTCLHEADTVVVTLNDYDTARALLGESDLLRYRDVISLMTGTPAEADDFAAFLALHGARHLDGAVEAYPSDVGTREAVIYFSGDRAVWDAHRSTLQAIAGASRFVDERAGAANVLDAALAGAFLNTAMGAACEAIAFLRNARIDLRDEAVNFDYWIDLLRSEVQELVRANAEGDFLTTDATLSVYTQAVRQWTSVALAAGVRGSLMTANLATLESAVAAGHGNEALAAQVRVMSEEA